MSRIIPKINFEKITDETNVGIIKGAYTGEYGDAMDLKAYTLECFPELKKVQDVNQSIGRVVVDYLKRNDSIIRESINRFSNVWNQCGDRYMNALSEILNIDWPPDCSQITCDVGQMPIFPREIAERMFAVSHWVKDDFFLEIAAHECCHFLYFEKWKQIFPDYDERDFEAPHLIWQLSEMVVDPILNHPKIKEVLGIDFKAYDYFYSENEQEMNTIKDLFTNSSIEDAIKMSYEVLRAI